MLSSSQTIVAGSGSGFDDSSHKSSRSIGGQLTIEQSIKGFYPIDKIKS